MNKFLYSLRLGLCPGFHTEEKFADLIQFCRQAEIDDIQFHLNMEELNRGHLTPGETEPWLKLLSSFKEELRREGVSFSLNPWTTTLHTDRGRKLKPGQEFTVMRDAKGRDADAVACPLCGNFGRDLKEMYSRYAELRFDIIWVEDDFRLHNHAPLDWGGCFCDLHMKEFSKAAGEEVTREEFVRGMLQKGEVHSYRRAWLDTMGRTMNSFSRSLSDAVRSIAPETRIGLMSSAPQAHCVEGRDWDTVISNFSGEHRPLNRPHLPAYREVAPQRYCLEFQRYSRLTAAFLPGNTELWPELDNFPHTTFSKSHAFSAFQIESSLSLCSEGIAVNVFDMIGNGIAKEQKNHNYLKKLRPYLNGFAGLKLKRSDEKGVRVMVDPASAYTLKTDGGDSPDSLRPWETFWAESLSAYGIANRYCTDRNVSGEIVAVSGQYFRNLSEEEVRGLFARNKVLLDGEAAFTLCDRGLSGLVGIKGAEWFPLNGGKHSFEQVCNGKRYQGLPEARMSAQGLSESLESGDWLNIRYEKEPEAFTELRSPDESPVGPGICRRDNMVIFPFGNFREDYLSFLHPVRQQILQELMMDFRPPAMVRNLPYVTVNWFMSRGSHTLLLTNYGSDDHENLDLILPFDPGNPRLISRETGETIPATLVKNSDGSWRLEKDLPAMTGLCLIL